MSIIGSNILAGASGQGGGYTIERSLRFRSSASAYLDNAVPTSGNLRKWTVSCWVKRGALGTNQYLFTETNEDGSGANIKYTVMGFDTSNQLVLRDRWGSSPGDESIVTSAVFRDPSAWYHIVFVRDSDNATQADRAIIYVNGVRQTVTGLFTQSKDSSWNLQTTAAYGQQQIGRLRFAGVWYYGSDFYMTEVNSVDGQALTPSSFGEYNEDTGVWQPTKYVGSYGTNGFYLPFSDNTTTTTLAADSSGNGNDWTPNNISLTSGATYDSMTDTPTPYADGGNYCTANPLITFTSNSPAMALLDGNLNITRGGSGWGMCGSTIAVSTGKWYWEATFVQSGSGDGILGIHKTNTTLFQIVGYSGDPEGYAYGASGSKFNNTTGTAYGASFTNGDLIGVALDLDAGTLTFYKNNSSQGTAFSSLSGEFYPAFSNDNSNGVGSWLANFGQRPFAYTPPTGFKPLHTGNLPDSAIVDGSEYFNSVLYTGNGSTQSITGVGFQPDFVWGKQRSGGTNSHSLHDVVRGATKQLYSNLTNAEYNNVNSLTSFDSDGFSVGSHGMLNGSGESVVAWNWKANGAGVSNTDGSITSTVSANPTAGFSIVTYTGTGSVATVGHGLGAAPNMIIAKTRSLAAKSWPIYSKEIGAGKYLVLNSTNGSATDTNMWQNTTPTSSVFNLGTDSWNNGSSATYVAYCFADVEGYSKFGSYTGNGSTDGPFVYLGFRPAFVIIKCTSASPTEWHMWDDKRSESNVMNRALRANNSNAESDSSDYSIDFLSNGLKIKNASNLDNQSGQTFIYMAFAEVPFSKSLAR